MHCVEISGGKLRLPQKQLKTLPNRLDRIWLVRDNLYGVDQKWFDSGQAPKSRLVSISEINSSPFVLVCVYVCRHFAMEKVSL